MRYFTPLVILVWLALIVLSILVFENNRIRKERKGVLFVTYAVVALAATAEWLGLILSGNANVPNWLLRLVKFFDYVLTPVAGGIVVLQFKKDTKIVERSIFGVLIANFIFQFISLFTNWMITIDENHVYHHGSLYVIYVVMYFIVIVLTIFEFALFGRKFRKKNRLSLYSILAFVVIAVTLQMVFSFRVSYIALTIALAFLFIHHSEFSQLSADDKIKEQKILITIDPLTGIANRYSYEQDLTSTDYNDDFVVFSVDINGLKRANDNFGHKAGDELILGTAETISAVLGKYGKCYRTGGDEFIALTHVSNEKIDDIIHELMKKADKWSGKEIKELSLSAGAASKKEFPTYSIDELVGEADQRMYKIKSEYYLSHHLDRRTH